MFNYQNFIFDDKLISPINNHECKIITKQNIKKFGFDDIYDLKTKFPNFPLICKNLSIYRSKKAKFEHANGHNSKVKEKRVEVQITAYIPKKCEKCENLIEFKNRKNSHCSRSCANSHKNSSETNQKISTSLTRFHASSKQSYTIFCSFCSQPQTRRKKPNNKSNLYSCKEKACKTRLMLSIAKMGASKGGKASAAKTIKRSKQEIELYNLLSMHFPNIRHNEQTANGWDADILLPDYKIAILWNGPWHYREMGFAKHSLKKVVNRDCIKIQEFENIGWIIKLYQDNHWTPVEAMIDVLLVAQKRVEQEV